MFIKNNSNINSGIDYGIQMIFQIHRERMNLLILKLAEDKQAATESGREKVELKTYLTPYSKINSKCI